MRMLLIAMALAAPAHADISDLVSVEGCKFHEMSDNWMMCDFTNHTKTAIVSVNVRHLYTEPGRTVPWADTSTTTKPFRTGPIAGGIEPGETVNHIVRSPGLSDRADPNVVDFNITPISAVTADGETLE